MRKRSIFVGFDPREADAFAVACASIAAHMTAPVQVRGLVLDDLQEAGLYYRPTLSRTNAAGRRQLIDELSIRDDYDGAMSTEFALTRFLVPYLARDGMALFMDADMLVRSNLARLFEQVEAVRDRKAVYCVKHDHQPPTGLKMDGQVQTAYSRKNWSSFMVFDCSHPANYALTLDLVNSVPGRDLHAFCWLKDEDIGEIGSEWNWLVGHSQPVNDPKVVHFTDGVPSMAGYENAPFAGEWRRTLSGAALSAMGYRR